MPPRHPLSFLRDAHWFGGPRARAYRWLLLLVVIGSALAGIATAHHGIDPMGRPLGTDFLAFWSASRLALIGDPAGAYDLGRLYAMEKAAMPVDPGLSCFLYPPAFLLVCLPFGLLPYFTALVVWLIATGTAYVAVVKRWLGDTRGALITILAFPAIVLNAGHGQNGFLTAALLGGGLWWLDRRPLVAGALLGLLVIKPQMAFAIPVLVLASGRWRVMAGGIASALTLCLASLLVFGKIAWVGFSHGGDTARAIIEQGLVPHGKMISLSAAIHILGGSSSVGYAAQALLATVVLGTLAIVAWSRRASPQSAAALAACATLLISPFMLDYDLTVSAIPLAWLFGEGVRRGFLPWEKLVLVLGFVLPLCTRDLALGLGIPVSPPVLVALFACTARAALWQPLGAATTTGDFRSSPSRH
jgi:alpha-1,2-mannosyltransferase